MGVGERFKHGIYEDKRQATGYQWYCPTQDWRFAISRAEVPNTFWHCPGCGQDVTEPVYDEVREGCP